MNIFLENHGPFSEKPDKFFEIVFHDVQRKPGLTGGAAGYEQGERRNEELAEYLFEWLTEFALPYAKLRELNSASARKMMRIAATKVYTTDKHQKRGEFGELLLHAILREVFDSQPAISKIYFKAATNETVKGFDTVHVVKNGDELELWLGEAKFYKCHKKAIRSVVQELKIHTNRKWLREEFILIDSKIDPDWQHAQELRALISERQSLDATFNRICIPVLITYESACVKNHTEFNEDFKNALKIELEAVYRQFANNELPQLRVHLFLIPLDEKETLTKILQNKLEGQQQ